MQLLLSIYLTILGFILGSFYNVVGLRIPLEQSVIIPRSSCANCNKVLTPLELIPVFSYLFQKGKCRGCQASISPVYPIMELVTGILFAVSPLLVGWGNELVFCYALISLLVIITVSDLAYMVIPDKILIVFAVIFLVLQLTIREPDWLDLIFGAVIGFGLLLGIALVSKGGMGGGDIKLFALLGFILGVKQVLLTLFFSVFFGTAVGVLLIVMGVVKRRQPVPFGPFIALGALTTYYFSERLIYWYFGVFT
ncbi:MAG: prepilin peptidase [Bacillus sp. (in: firmicutes)]